MAANDITRSGGVFGKLGNAVVRWPLLVVVFWVALAAIPLLTLPPLAEIVGRHKATPLPYDAPTMVTTMTLVQRRTPPGRLNEGMTLAVTGLLGGIACGSAAGGWTVEHVSPVAGFGVPVTAAAAALMIALVSTRATKPSPSP